LANQQQTHKNMSSSSSNRPDFLRLPPRTPKEALISTCFVSTDKIVSMYTIDELFHVEMARTTSSFLYKTHEDAEKALKMMLYARSHTVDDNSYWIDLPTACGGGIRLY
jgi:hypothetical protein